MSLQPGPQDPTDDSALTPASEEGDQAPVAEEAQTWAMPPTPAAPPAAAAPPESPAGGPAPWTVPPPAGGQGAPAQGDPWAAQPPPAGGAYPPPPPPPAGGTYPPPPPPTGGYPAASAYGTPPPTGGAAYPPPYGAAGYPAPQPGYPAAGTAPYGYAGARQNEGKAVVGLILAIASWVVCPVVLAVIALVLAGQSNRAIDASGGRLEGRSMNTATKWIAWLNIVLMGLVIVGSIIVLIAVAANGGFNVDVTDGPTAF